MKKLFLIAAMAVSMISANAQNKFNLSTLGGTNLSQYDGKVCQVNVTRYMVNGWNTIALPFDMSEAALNEVFGSDCKLEKLVSVDANGTALTLCFQDSKQGGLKANTPYILHFNGETGNVKFTTEALVSNQAATLNFETLDGEALTMSAAQTHNSGQGLYGILAVDNGEAKFVAVTGESSGFYATRCFVQLSSGSYKQLSTIHLGKDVAGINSICAADEVIDVYNLAGQRVATQVRASEVGKLQPAVYVVKGTKILVK